MSYQKYVDWIKMWKLEVVKKDQSHLEGTNKILFNNVKQDVNINIVNSDCEITCESICFMFAFSWGQTPSDTQGNFMSYYVECDLDFNVVNVIYDQG